MKSKTLIALAVAGTCAWSASALAGGMHETRMNTGMSVEVETPSAVNESAPWLTGEPHLGGWSSSEPSSMAYSESESGIGASSSVSGFGSVSSDTLTAGEATEYWLIGSEGTESNVGSSAMDGAVGSVSFDSSSAADDLLDPSYSYETVIYTSSAGALSASAGEATPLVTEYYLVSGPLASFDGADALVLAIAPTAEDIALLGSLTEEYFIVTPSEDFS